MNAVSRKKKKVKKSKKIYNYLGIIGFFCLVIAVWVAVSFLQNRQIINQNAAPPTIYGTCVNPALKSQTGNCYAQTCASVGANPTPYYSETIPASSYSTCALAGYAQGVAPGTVINCCPSGSTYTNNFGACGATNNGVCTTDACTPLTTPDSVPTACGYSGYSQNVALGTTMFCCSVPPTPTPTPSPDPCSTLKIFGHPNCGLTNTFSGRFCGGNAFPSQCQLGGSATTLYTCQCSDALGNNCHSVAAQAPQDCTQAPFNTCIAVPGGINADHCGNVQLSGISFSLYGIGFGGNQNPNHKTRTYTLMMKNHQTASSQIISVKGIATYDNASGNFTDNNLTLNGISPGQYDIILHVDGYLNKKIYPSSGASFFTVDATGKITSAPAKLTAGDIAPSPIGDNTVDIQDYNNMTSCINGTCPNGALADLDDNGVVNDLDMQILLNGFGSIGDSFSTSSFNCVVDPSCGRAGNTLQMCELICSLKTTP